MSEIQVYQDWSWEKVSQLKNFRVHNITTTDRSTLGGTLNTNHKGLLVYDTDLQAMYTWDGSAWDTVSSTITGAVVLRGVVGYNAAEPGSPATGDYYIFNTAGTNTWESSVVVQSGDSVVWDGTNWQYIQGNTVAASETVSGILEIATQAETNAGSDDTRAVTPNKLAGYASSKAFAKTYYELVTTITANTPYTVTHNLGLQNRNSFIINAMNSAHSQIMLDVDSVDANSLTVTSAVTLSSVYITVIGF